MRTASSLSLGLPLAPPLVVTFDYKIFISQRKKIGLVKRILGSLFGGLFGELQINEAINPCGLTKNNYNVKKWIDDPLSQKGMW